MIFYKPKPKIIVMCGIPGSGKSTYASLAYPEYIQINQDELKTKEKCIEKAHDLLTQNKSIVIDRTNVTKDQRKIWIDIAKEYKIEPPKLIFLQADPLLCYYRICKREGHPTITNNMTLEKKRSIINKFASNLEIPDITEGFHSVSTINSLDLDLSAFSPLEQETKPDSKNSSN